MATAALIKQIIEGDEATRQQARQDLAALEQKALYPLLKAMNQGEIPPEEVFLTLEIMDDEYKELAWMTVIDHPNLFTEETIAIANERLSAMGIDPSALPAPPDENKSECKEVEAPIDDKWTDCKLTLEHPASSGWPCYWLSVIVHFWTEEKEFKHFSFSSSSKESVEAFIKQLRQAGFKQTGKSSMREMEYLNFKRQ